MTSDDRKPLAPGDWLAPGGYLDTMIGHGLDRYDDGEIVDRLLPRVALHWGDGRRARARLAERVAEIRKRTGPPSGHGQVEATDDHGDLPGDLSWEQIAAEYHRLAAAAPGWRRRRRRPNEPSRPEVAGGLNTSAATLRRACVAAGKGSKWPPAGL